MRSASVLARRLLLDADGDSALRIIAKDTTRDLANLKARARRAVGRRGHQLGRWERDGHRAHATCRCGAWVQVNVDPQANSLDIGGPALTQSCG
jgi:hypothetical protein